MTTFTSNVTDPVSLLAVTEVRKRYNLSLTPEKDQDGKPKPIETHPGYLATDNAYIEMVVISACESYAKQLGITNEQIAKTALELEHAKQIRGIKS